MRYTQGSPRPFADFDTDASPRRLQPEHPFGPRRVGFGSILAVIILIGIYSHVAEPFLPTPELLALTEDNAVALMAGLAVLLVLVSAAIPAHPSSPARSKWAVVPMIALFAIFAPDIASRGLPAVHAGLLRAPEGTQIVTVVEKGRASRRRRCNHAATVTWEGAEGYLVSICGIPGKLHRDLYPGQRLALTGQRTKWGIRYFQIEPAREAGGDVRPAS